jgi:mevalonate kinase
MLHQVFEEDSLLQPNGQVPPPQPLHMVQASAPGKCILFGEHAVVYGQPAVAVAIDQRMTVSLEISDVWRIDGMRFSPERHPHVESLKQRLWADGPSLSIKVNGDIPPASGLGSSAALSVAASAALRCARGRQIKDDDWGEGWTAARPNAVYTGPWDVEQGDSVQTGKDSVDVDECAILSHAVEASAQGGRASPLDSSTCSHGGCIVLSDNVEPDLNWLYSRTLNDVSWEVHAVDLPEEIDDVWLVIGNTGIHAPTSEQVAKVAKLLENEPGRMREIETIGIISRRGIAALKEGNMEGVGRAMSENHLLLRSIGVSCPELEALISAAAPSSLGVKLTGAGGGGCMIALTRNPKETSEAIELAGGRTLISKIAAQGLIVDSDENSPLWNPFE